MFCRFNSRQLVGEVWAVFPQKLKAMGYSAQIGSGVVWGEGENSARVLQKLWEGAVGGFGL